MKVTVTNRSPEKIEERDYKDALQITVETDAGRDTLRFHDGEPEDATLIRNFSAVYTIPSLLRKAYEAGKNGEGFELSEQDSNDI